MKLNLTEVLLEGRTIDTEVPFELKELDYSFGSFPVTESGPVSLSVVRTQKKLLKIHGKVSLKLTIPCDRCLTDLTYPMDLDFEEQVPCLTEEDPAIDGDEEESAFERDYFIEGYNLDVDKLIYGEALLNWPSRVLCSEDCRGLCPVCGKNLNRGECGCDRTQLDPRMAKVLDIFSNYKEV